MISLSNRPSFLSQLCAFQNILLSAYLSLTLAAPALNTPLSTAIPLEIWDCPGNITVDTLGAPLSDFATIVFVIDIRVSPLRFAADCYPHRDPQDVYQQPVSKLVEFIVAACQVNPDINFEVFVHKAERLQEDDKLGMFVTHVFIASVTKPAYRKLSPDT
jgi:hypothetical protein